MAGRGEAERPLNPEGSVTTAPARPRRTALELAIIVIGGWVITTIARGVLNSMLEGQEMLAISIGSLLSLAWYGVLAYEGYHWFASRPRADVARPATAGPGASPARIPAFGIASIASTVLVWFWVYAAFYTPNDARGESALIGLFASIFLCVMGILVGTACGIVSIVTKERHWIGKAGLWVNLATAGGLIVLVWRGFAPYL
jgi:hypothetical protein